MLLFECLLICHNFHSRSLSPLCLITHTIIHIISIVFIHFVFLYHHRVQKERKMEVVLINWTQPCLSFFLLSFTYISIHYHHLLLLLLLIFLLLLLLSLFFFFSLPIIGLRTFLRYTQDTSKNSKIQATLTKNNAKSRSRWRLQFFASLKFFFFFLLFFKPTMWWWWRCIYNLSATQSPSLLFFFSSPLSLIFFSFSHSWKETNQFSY